MRLTRIISVVIGLLAAVPAVQAQHSAALLNEACGCNACGAPVCCPPLFPGLTEGIHDALGSLFCCPGLNARHDIYRAALHRNDFGKCSKYVPFYSGRTCCCGGAHAACPHCGSGAAVEGEEVMEMQAVPEGTLEPTPAPQGEAAPTPVEPVAPQSLRGRSFQMPQRAAAVHRAQPAAASKTARKPSMRDRVARAEIGDEAAAPVARTSAQQPTKTPSLIERAMLLQSAGDRR